MIRIAQTPTHPIALSQPWLETPEPSFQLGRVQLQWKSDALLLRAELDDLAIVSAATAHSQRLFALGDTLEVFLKRPESEEYYELHVNPRNFRTAMRWTPGAVDNIRASDQGRIEDFVIDPALFSSTVEKSGISWTVDIEVPPALLGVDEWRVGQVLYFSVSRYDYAEWDGTPILSTIATHPVINFHRIEDWRHGILV